VVNWTASGRPGRVSFHPSVEPQMSGIHETRDGVARRAPPGPNRVPVPFEREPVPNNAPLRAPPRQFTSIPPPPAHHSNARGPRSLDGWPTPDLGDQCSDGSAVPNRVPVPFEREPVPNNAPLRAPHVRLPPSHRHRPIIPTPAVPGPSTVGRLLTWATSVPTGPPCPTGYLCPSNASRCRITRRFAPPTSDYLHPTATGPSFRRRAVPNPAAFIPPHTE
jgi:hypothetical protein